MDPIRVLVVDDSSAMRRLMREAVESDPGLQVVGTAGDGKSALERIAELKPDVMTLDLEMPVLDGLQTLAALRERRVRLPVVVVSTLTTRGASATFDALSLGASDYVTKPSATDASGLTPLERLKRELLPRLKALAAPLRPGPKPAAAPLVSAAPPAARPGLERVTPVDLVVIGGSTGGPNALSAILPALPAGFRAPICIVQHMPPLFTQLLAERLTARGPLKVHEAQDGMVLQPGCVYLAPGDHHLEVEGSVTLRTRVHQGPPEHSCRPAVDVLFRSAARAVRQRTLALVLTGMGNDGLAGAREIHAAGGSVLVQDEASSVVWGMPGAVARAGLALEQVPLDRLAAALSRRCGLQGGALAAPTAGGLR